MEWVCDSAPSASFVVTSVRLTSEQRFGRTERLQLPNLRQLRRREVRSAVWIQERRVGVGYAVPLSTSRRCSTGKNVWWRCQTNAPLGIGNKRRLFWPYGPFRCRHCKFSATQSVPQSTSYTVSCQSTTLWIAYIRFSGSVLTPLPEDSLVRPARNRGRRVGHITHAASAWNRCCMWSRPSLVLSMVKPIHMMQPPFPCSLASR